MKLLKIDRLVKQNNNQIIYIFEEIIINIIKI